MTANIIAIESLQSLNEVFNESHARPVVLFKHSTTCGTSAHVLEMISTINSEINLVVVQSHRDLSNEIAAITGYRHHSPQAFVIKNGRPVYYATHYSIDPAAIEAHLDGSDAG